MLSAVLRDEDHGGAAVGVLVLEPKVFASGRVGYFGQGKVTIDVERYQCQVQAVRIEKHPEAEHDNA